ncbi:hypothetical protein [Nostoc sp.]
MVAKMFSKKWQRLLYILAFFLIVLLGDRLIAARIDQVVMTSQFRLSSLYRGGQNKELVVLGNSRGVNSIYAPDIEKNTGLSVINLSYNGMSMQLGEALFSDYLEHNSPPKLLILEITNLFSSDDLIKDLKIYIRSSNRIKALIETIEPQIAFGSNLSYLFSLNSEMLFRVIYYLNKSDQTWINRSQINPQLLISVKKMQPLNLEIKNENIKALLNIIHVADQKGINIRLLVSPYLPVYADKIANLSQQIKTLQETVGEKQRIWNYSKGVGNLDGFADRLHMNYKGSTLLMKKLDEAGFFQINDSAI